VTDGGGIPRGGRTDPRPESGRLGRSAFVLGASTLVARISGYFRTVVVASTIGVGLLANAFATANAFPNMLFELLVGGGLRSVLVPTLVTEFERDREAGWRSASAVFNLVVLVLVPTTAAAVLAAPLLFRLLTFGATGPLSAELRAVGTILLALMIPQVVFYGVDLVATGVLNAHRRYALPLLAVVAGNGVAAAAVALYGSLRRGGASLHLTRLEYVLLGGGMTAGVAVIAAVQFVPLRRLGLQYSAQLGRGIDAVRRGVRAAGWMLLYVMSNQLGLLVVLILANRVVGGVAAYQYAYTFFLLPYSIVGLAIAGAMLPEVSAHAARGDRDGARAVTGQALGWAIVILIPSSVALVVGAPPIVNVFLGYGAIGDADVAFIAPVLAAFGAGLVPFGIFQLLARLHYAFHDTKTPALVNAAAVGINIAMDLGLFALLEGRTRVVGLAVGHAISYAVAAAALWILARSMLERSLAPNVPFRFEPLRLALRRRITRGRGP
jgi:putative peptidoglycan lipid II flippase